MKDDCLEVKPTLFVSVPRIFNKIVEGVSAKFEAESGVKKCLIDMGLSSKLESMRVDGSYSSCFYDSLVFSKVQAGFGGNIRLMISGSAPLS